MEEVRGKDNPETLRVLDLLAGVLDCCGKYSEAVKVYREYLNLLGEEKGREALFAKCRLCTILQKLGNYGEAEKVSQEVVKMCEKEYGNDHRETLWAIEMNTRISETFQKITKRL
jgi:tetratricopeptide (TPR) repeat protein